MRLGLDLDNTLICLDPLFFQRAVQRGLLPATPILDKTGVRDTLRRQPHGEKIWQRLQAEVYGPGLTEATLMAGAADFLLQCRNHGVTTVIVSHKTPFAGHEPWRYDIRASALAWLTDQGFFQPEGFALTHDQLFFEVSRQDKVQRIGDLHLDWFVDDLPEVLTDGGFPLGVKKIWFNPSSRPPLAGILSCTTWREIGHHVFGG